MEAWFNELKDNSHRDQLSFNYVLWKNSDINIIYLDKLIYKSEWFKWNTSHSFKTSLVSKGTSSDTRQRIERRKEEFRKQLELKRKQRVTTQSIGIY